jgi:quercetin dioxygenase-like cupin family protein
VEAVNLTYSWDANGSPIDFARPNELPIDPDKMFHLERALATLPQADFKLVNRFLDGLYARQVTLPKGCLLTSKVHLRQHLAFILTGDVSVWTDQDFQRVKAPQVIVTEPGTKRVLFAHEDTTWITVHASKAKSVEEAEAELVCNDPEMIERARQQCHSG